MKPPIYEFEPPQLRINLPAHLQAPLPQNSSYPPERANSNRQQDNAMRCATLDSYLVDQSIAESARAPLVMRWHRTREILGRVLAQRQSELKTSRTEPNFLDVRKHNFVNATFSKRGFVFLSEYIALIIAGRVAINCRVCVEPLRKGAVFCCRCCLAAHSKCAALAPRGCPPDHRNEPYPSTTIPATYSPRHQIRPAPT